MNSSFLLFPMCKLWTKRHLSEQCYCFVADSTRKIEFFCPLFSYLSDSLARTHVDTHHRCDTRDRRALNVYGALLIAIALMCVWELKSDRHSGIWIFTTNCYNENSVQSAHITKRRERKREEMEKQTREWLKNRWNTQQTAAAAAAILCSPQSCPPPSSSSFWAN